MSYLTVTPAYGRDYRSKKEALADWEAGQDFINTGPGGTYVSKRDIGPGVIVSIRYKRLTEIAQVR